MLKLLRSFVDSLLRPYEYAEKVDQSQNIGDVVDGEDAETIILNKIELAVKTSILALVLVGLPKNIPEDPPPRKPPNYDLLAKLSKKAGENLKNQIQKGGEEVPERVERRKENGILIIRRRGGLGPPPKPPVLKESQKILQKEHIQKVSKALVPLEKEDLKSNKK